MLVFNWIEAFSKKILDRRLCNGSVVNLETCGSGKDSLAKNRLASDPVTSLIVEVNLHIFLQNKPERLGLVRCKQPP